MFGHYSKPIDYSEELLKENLIKWRQVETCHYELIHANNENGENVDELIKKIGADFDNALDDDLNTHLALSAFFQLVKESNRLAAEEKLGKENSLQIKTELKRMLEILGLSIPEITENEKQEIDELIKNREESRKGKKYDEADKIRDKLNEMNIELIDHKGKTIWMRKEKIKAEK